MMLEGKLRHLTVIGAFVSKRLRHIACHRRKVRPPISPTKFNCTCIHFREIRRGGAAREFSKHSFRLPLKERPMRSSLA